MTMSHKGKSRSVNRFYWFECKKSCQLNTNFTFSPWWQYKNPVWSKFLCSWPGDLTFNNSNCLPLSLCLRVCEHEQWCLNTEYKCCIQIRKKNTPSYHYPCDSLTFGFAFRIITLPITQLPSLHIILTDGRTIQAFPKQLQKHSESADLRQGRQWVL